MARTTTEPSVPQTTRRSRSVPAWVRRWAGPTLIVGSVLIVLHGFWLSAKLTSQQVDLLAFWLPRWCYLGTNLAHGHIATWLPNQFGGVPFVSDPQSGWLYLPVMLLFSTLSGARALGLFITLQPILAGLGMYVFFRQEGLGRPASTAGGTTLALTMSGSVVALSLPFAGMLAWTALSLAGASGFLHARTTVRRLAWFAFAELSLSQIAAAHLTDGLLIGAGVVALYVLARSIVQVRAGTKTAGRAALLGLALFAAFPLLSAAVLVPRLALLPRTPIGHGYQAAGRLANRLSGTNGPPPLYTHGFGPWWGTAFARGPGGYVGALAILLIPVALASKRWRWPAGAFALAGFVGWVLNLDRLIASARVRTFVLSHRIGELWLRSPYRFRYLMVLAFAGMAGYGTQAWLDMARVAGRRELARRAAWLVPPVLVFAALPLLAGSHRNEYVPFALGLVFAVPLLLVASRGVRWAAVALPIALAVELTVVGLVAQRGPLPRNAPDRLEQVAGPGLSHSFPKFHAPFITPGDYLTPGPIGRTLIQAGGSHERYLSFSPGIATRSPRGFLFHQDFATWPAYENGRSILFGIDEIQGYSPVQLEPYWRLVRTVDTRASIYYNSATFQSLDPAVLRLFGVEWVIQPTRLPPPSDASLSVREGRYSLYRMLDPDPRASLVFTWQVVRGGTALPIVSQPAFPPADVAILDSEPAASSLPAPPSISGATGTATYRELAAEHVQVDTSATGAAILLVRNAFDRNWHATLDGRPVPIMVTDYLMQGVAVPAGDHVVDLEYRDAAVGKGLVASAVAWGLLSLWLGWLAWLAWVARQRTNEPRGGAPAV